MGLLFFSTEWLDNDEDGCPDNPLVVTKVKRSSHREEMPLIIILKFDHCFVKKLSALGLLCQC